MRRHITSQHRGLRHLQRGGGAAQRGHEDGEQEVGAAQHGRGAAVGGAGHGAHPAAIGFNMNPVTLSTELTTGFTKHSRSV